MFELVGKYAKAIVMIDNVEEGCISQIMEFLNHPMYEGSIIRIMPDCLTEDAEILTLDGFKFIKDVTYSDKVSSVDISNMQVRFKYY